MPDQQCASWDFTISCEKFPDKNDLMKLLSKWCKKWVFQQEKGETSGFLHWQGRVSLIKKKRESEIIKQIPIPGRWSKTCTKVHQGQNFNYVMKADTHVDGPWSDQDFDEPPPLTRQLKKFMADEMRPWQTTLKDLLTEEDDRSIKLIIDKTGNSGKSIFSEYLEYNGLAYEIPPFRLMEDIMQCAMCIKTQKCYIIDMPRALKKDKLSEFYSGLECLKNGVCYDKRYSFKKRRMDRPQVVVFTNKDPCWDYMSMDRWEIYDMTPNFSLEKRSLGAAL